MITCLAIMLWVGTVSSWVHAASCPAPSLSRVDDVTFGAASIEKIPSVKAGSSFAVEGLHFFRGCPEQDSGCWGGEVQTSFPDFQAELRGPVEIGNDRFAYMRRHGYEGAQIFEDMPFDKTIGLNTIHISGGWPYRLDETIRLPVVDRGLYLLFLGPVATLVRVG